jgi:catechol 2,3-dioxygenase-like lactoylglutathione lyase family enzyme
MSIVKGLHHAQITIPKGAEDSARGFYCGVLGLKELKKPENLAGRGGFWLDLLGIELHVGAEDGFNRTSTKAHLAYDVSNLEAAMDAIRSAGLEILIGPDIPGISRFESRDPFGNRIEFVQRVTE